jgi:hypothetical protein
MVERLNIVPVSISYEFDPCDALKAKELAAVATEGKYQKSEFEDIDSIVKGITGAKGHVHVDFGEPIKGNFDTPEALAAEIDRQILSGYYLHPTHLAAAGRTESDVARQLLQERLVQVDELAQPYLKNMYANPVFNRERVEQAAKGVKSA